MADSFFHDPYLAEKSYDLQWKSYLQDQYYGAHISSSIATASEQQTYAIRESGQQQVDAMRESARLVSAQLESGFENISIKLDDISGGISDLSSLFDWRMSMIIEEQRINNILSENIALLLRIPEFQKERQYHMEQGLKFFKNARMDKDLYADALEHLLEAEKREKTDYFILHRIGLIYLYSDEKLINIPKAEEYFRKAAKYAIVESHPDAVRLTNILAGNVKLQLTEQITPQEAIKAVAAESYFQEGVACYIQGKFSEAEELAGKAFSLAPEMLEAGFTQAKALAADGKDTQAAKVLEKVIPANRNYAVKTVSDLDLGPKPAIHQLLERLRDDAITQARQRLEKCKVEMISESKAKLIVESIGKLIAQNTYLDALSALDEMAKIRHWKFCEHLKNQNQLNCFNKLIEIISSLKKLRYYKIDYHFNRMDSKFRDTIIDKINQETPWIFPYSEKNNESKWTNSIENKVDSFNEATCDVVKFIELEKKFNDNLLKVINNLENLLQKYSNENAQHLNYLDNQRKKAEDFFQKAIEEEKRQDKKWIFSNYNEAWRLYEESLSLYEEVIDPYSGVVKQRIEILRKKLR